MPNDVITLCTVSGPDVDLFIQRHILQDQGFCLNSVIPRPSDITTNEACNTWGVMRNASGYEMKERGPCHFTFKFFTPWDFPTPVFNRLAWLYPTLIFSVLVIDGA